MFCLAIQLSFIAGLAAAVCVSRDVTARHSTAPGVPKAVLYMTATGDCEIITVQVLPVPGYTQ